MRWQPGVASARTGRCPECRDKILVPFDWLVSWHVDDLWVHDGRRIVESHAEAAHPDRPPYWLEGLRRRER